MESSDGLDGDIAVDGSVGAIVWVRRRNGSWWPGRILGPDELSASHLMSPRSGTPVKLLGRDDASVDWYNLEKSKRVKAFRCGEFDACIERAEASQGIPIKKREKYARREDAILHALELEMEQNKLGKIASGISNKTSSASKRELSNIYSEVHMRNDEPRDHRKFASHKSPTVSRKGALSHEEDNVSNSFYVRKGRNSKQFGWEENISDAIPRMRGLQDFGLRIAPSNRKLSQSVTWETSRELGDAHLDVLSSVDHVMGGASHAGSSKHPLSIKRKMSPGSMVEESLFRKRDRHRPLVQVLQSSTKLPVSPSFQSDYDGGVISMQGEKDHMGAVCRAKRSRCIYLPADSNDSLDISGYHSEETAITAAHFGMDDHLHHPASFAEEYTSSGLMEATESDSSERGFWEADMEDRENLLTDTSPDLIPEPKASYPLEYQIPDKSGNIENDVMPLSNHLPQSPLHEHYADASAEAGVSKWHMKGKRNIRNLAKRPIVAMDGKVSLSSAHKSIGFSKGTTHKSKGSSFRMGRAETSSQRTLARGLYHRKYFNHASDRGDLTDTNLGHARLTGYDNRRYPFPSESAKDRGRSHISLNGSDNESELMSQSGWEADGPSHAAQRAYWGESDKCFDPVNDEMGPMLVDVDLKVQTSYQGEHVPLVSLMSRLNGKAIIGHPVQIEILEDGSAGHLVVSRNDTGLDERAAPPPVWRTARRTAMQRVPRSNPVTSALESEDAEPLHCSDLESKPLFTKSYSGHFNHQAKLVKKSISHTRSPMSGKSQKKLLKRVSLSSQKTRMLSSIATDQKPSGEKFSQLPKGGSILGGLIKAEGGVPIVTCVPVKVAFSRILEAVGRPSAAVAHRVQATSPAVMDPSQA